MYFNQQTHESFLAVPPESNSTTSRAFGHKFSIDSDYAPPGKEELNKNAHVKVAPQSFGLKLRTCEVQDCGLVANAGVCTFKIMGGVSKGCGRYFCQEHCGSKGDDFKPSNFDEFRPYDEEALSEDPLSDNRPTKPFDRAVCVECRPRLKRAYNISCSLFVGIPALVSLAAVFVYGAPA